MVEKSFYLRQMILLVQQFNVDYSIVGRKSCGNDTVSGCIKDLNHPNPMEERMLDIFLLEVISYTPVYKKSIKRPVFVCNVQGALPGLQKSLCIFPKSRKK